MASGNEIFPNGPMELPGEPEKQSSVRAPHRKRMPNRKLIVIMVILVLAAGGFGVYKVLSGSKSSTKSSKQQSTATDAPTETADGTSDVPSVSEEKTFTGNFPRAELTHPSSWSVTETPDKGIRVESPEFTYTLLDGTTTKGNFRIYLRQGARDIDSKYIGRGVASLPTEVLKYIEPAPGQQTETNLSFFGLDTDDHFAFFFIAGYFNLQKGDTLGPSYGKEPETYIISGGYSAKTLADDLATNPVSLDKFNQTNAYRQAMDIIESLKLL